MTEKAVIPAPTDAAETGGCPDHTAADAESSADPGHAAVDAGSSTDPDHDAVDAGSSTDPDHTAVDADTGADPDHTSAAPKDPGDTRTADGDPVPADGKPVPADGKPVPADGKPVPADGEPADEGSTSSATADGEAAGEESTDLAAADEEPDPAPAGGWRALAGVFVTLGVVALLVGGLVFVGLRYDVANRLLNPDRTADARVGDCLGRLPEVAEGGQRRAEARLVSCGSPDAAYDVAGRIDGLTGEEADESRRCEPFVAATGTYYTYRSVSPGGTGYLLCLVPRG